MKFDLQEEVKFIKIRFVGLLLAIFVLIAGIVGAFAGIIKSNRQEDLKIPSVQYVSDTADTDTSNIAGFLLDNYVHLVKTTSPAIGNTKAVDQEQVALARKSFYKILDSVETRTLTSAPAEKKDVEKILAGYRNLAGMTGKVVATGKDTTKETANLFEVSQLQTAVKQKEDKIQELQQQLQQASLTQNRDVQNLLAENKLKDAKIQDLQKQLQQVPKPQQADLQKILADNKLKDAKIQDLQKQLQQVPKPQQADPQKLLADNKRKDDKIQELQNQLKVAQSNKSKAPTGTISQAAYQELVDKNKYLDFDVRSVVKTNLQLSKENSALKKSLQDLNNQLKKGGQ